MSRKHVTAERRATYLAHLRETGSKLAAAKAAGASARTFRRHAKADASFKDAEAQVFVEGRGARTASRVKGKGARSAVTPKDARELDPMPLPAPEAQSEPSPAVLSN